MFTNGEYSDINNHLRTKKHKAAIQATSPSMNLTSFLKKDSTGKYELNIRMSLR
jgi:hypothetical protein